MTLPVAVFDKARQVEQYRKQAEAAKTALDFEGAFLLMDLADELEQQLNSQ